MPASTHQSQDLARTNSVLTPEEELSLVGFLAGYSGLTREACQLDLRQYVQWCAERRTRLFGARRADIEGFGRARRGRDRVLCAIVG
jgi:hypothetical protein